MPDVQSCGLYTRISRDDDGTALGVARQLADCQREAERRGWPVARIFEDNDKSASSGKRRPAYEALLAAIQAETIDAVIVWDVDRLTRTPSELEQFITLADRYGLALASIGGEVDLATPQGRLTARIKGSVARHEVEQMSRRLKRRFQDNAVKGQPHGVIPFGYRRLPVLDAAGKVAGYRDAIHEAEAAALRECYRRVIAGDSLRFLAKYLNEAGYRTIRGNPWQGSVLGRTLQRSRYVGLRTHKGQIIGPGDWDPIVDQDTFDRAVAVLTDPNRAPSRGLEPKYLGSGLYLCGRCGTGLRPNVSPARQPAYICPACMKLTRKMEPVDEVVQAVMVARLSQSDVTIPTGAEPEALAAAVAARDAALARMDSAADAFAAGTISARQLARITDGLQPQLQAAERNVKLHQPSGALEGMTGPDAADSWAAASLGRKREIIRALANVTVLPSGSGVPFSPEHIKFEWKASP